MMRIELNHPQHEAIQSFLDSAPGANAGHRPAWLEILRDGLGHRPWALTAWRDNQVVGYLPLVETRSILFGRHLVSLPYLNQAGLLADEAATAQALLEHATALARQRRARDLELRNDQVLDLPGLRRIRRSKVRLARPLPADPQQLWQDLPAKVRNQVRKAAKHSLDVKVGGRELLAEFYAVFSANMRDLGSPAFPRRLFEAILHHLQRDAELVLVRQGDLPVAGALLVHSPGVTEVPSASSLRAWNHTCANMLMYWQLMQRAIERGAETFDFGRSTAGSGPHRFKMQWGAVESPTSWQQLALTASAQPVAADDGRFDLAIETWKRLPIWLTRRIGPVIACGLP